MVIDNTTFNFILCAFCLMFISTLFSFIAACVFARRVRRAESVVRKSARAQEHLRLCYNGLTARWIERGKEIQSLKAKLTRKGCKHHHPRARKEGGNA